MKIREISSAFGLLVVGVLIALSGCKPDYPDCETDKDCKAKEFCVNRKCQQCRDTRDCPDGTACQAGKCSPISGFCRDKSQCPAGQECIANRCKPCTADGEGPTGLRCNRGQCMRPPCINDEQCPQDQECQNGFCVPARTPRGLREDRSPSPRTRRPPLQQRHHSLLTLRTRYPTGGATIHGSRSR